MVSACLSTAVHLDKYPKSEIYIHILVLEDDGGILAGAVNAASLALADAGIELFDLVSAATVVGTLLIVRLWSANSWC